MFDFEEGCAWNEEEEAEEERKRALREEVFGSDLSELEDEEGDDAAAGVGGSDAGVGEEREGEALVFERSGSVEL